MTTTSERGKDDMDTIRFTEGELAELRDYVEERARMSDLEDTGQANPDEWASVDDEAHRLLNNITERLNIVARGTQERNPA